MNPVPLLLVLGQTIRETELTADRPVSPTESRSYRVEIGNELSVIVFPPKG